MGSWFSNLHIRKDGTMTEEAIDAYIRKLMAARDYLPAESEQEADGAFAILSDERSQWYSVYSDLFSFDDPKAFSDYATPMSAEWKTDILGISCFDSDYLYLNLIDSENQVNAWAGIGSAMGTGIWRRTNTAAWKGKVIDHNAFRESIKKKFVFAEDVLSETAHCLELPQELSVASYEHLSDQEWNTPPTYLYFKLPDTKKTKAAPILVQHTISMMPCFPERPSIVSAVNTGGESKGLSVYFLGPYVEHEEITFSDVCFLSEKNGQFVENPVALKKVRLSDGQWAYYHHDPAYRLPPKVDDRLPPVKRTKQEMNRSVTVRFIPHGDPAKILDITVVLVPDQNLQGQTAWNVWHRFGSKKAYIQYHNQIWKNKPGCEDLLLREEDYDQDT